MVLVNAIISIEHLASALPFNFPPSCHSSSGLLSYRPHLSEKVLPWLEGKRQDRTDGVMTEVKCRLCCCWWRHCQPLPTHCRASEGPRRRWGAGAGGEVKGLSPLMTDFVITVYSCIARRLMEKIRHLITSAGAMDDICFPLSTLKLIWIAFFNE